MDKVLLKKEYRRLLVQAIEGRSGGAALMAVLEEVDFYNSPASAKHHLNVSGGLVLHSLNVARTALELCEKMPQFAKCDKNAVLTAALLHDVCKAGKYIKKQDTYLYKARKVKSLARSTYTSSAPRKCVKTNDVKQCKHTFRITDGKCAPCSGYNVECRHYEENGAADTKHHSCV